MWPVCSHLLAPAHTHSGYTAVRAGEAPGVLCVHFEAGIFGAEIILNFTLSFTGPISGFRIKIFIVLVEALFAGTR